MWSVRNSFCSQSRCLWFLTSYPSLWVFVIIHSSNIDWNIDFLVICCMPHPLVNLCVLIGRRSRQMPLIGWKRSNVNTWVNWSKRNRNWRAESRIWRREPIASETGRRNPDRGNEIRVVSPSNHCQAISNMLDPYSASFPSTGYGFTEPGDTKAGVRWDLSPRYSSKHFNWKNIWLSFVQTLRLY